MPNQATHIGDEQEMLARLAELSTRVAELEGELSRSERLATLGTLVGAIAHEFNNILTPVMSYAQLALNDPADRDLTVKALQKAVDGTEKAAHIASSVLGFVRDDESPACADVNAVVNDTLTCLAREPEKDGIEVVTDVPSDCWVAMRPIALQQVLMNLVLNALEALRPHPGRITLRCECSTWNQGPSAPTKSRQPASSGPVRITVSDTGRGIPPEVMSRLFQPFVRSRRGINERRGTGLGLTICKKLVTEAGGTIEAATAAGQGTTFTITLPRTSAITNSKQQAA